MNKRLLWHKYKAVPTTTDGIRFDSKKEAAYYAELQLRVRAGEVLFFLRQVPIHQGSIRLLVIDFVEFHADQTVHFVDVKGYETAMFKKNRRLVESLYPIEIETV